MEKFNMKDNTSDELDTRRYTNAIRDAYTLTEADSILQQLITKKVNEAERRGRIDELEKTAKQVLLATGYLGEYSVIKNRLAALQSTQDGGDGNE